MCYYIICVIIYYEFFKIIVVDGLRCFTNILAVANERTQLNKLNNCIEVKKKRLIYKFTHSWSCRAYRTFK
jgi:hypothetical protein